jgi:putative nucleotidyltransferase with HDIG domain
LRAVPVAHQFLLKPCDPEMLRAGIARATSLGEVLDSKMLTSLVGALRELPSLPRVFTELKLALARPSTTIEQVAQIVEQDVAVSAKILQLVNSAFFGLARDVSDLKTAVSCLGMSVLHDLVVTLEVFRSLTPNEYVSEEYLEEFHRHAQLTARIAAGIAQDAHLPPAVVLAALMHDVGKLVIAERTPAHFARALLQAEQEARPLFEIEEKLIHISHAEVGAYLLSLWGLPFAIVEAVAHHHHPRRVPPKGLDMLLVVYVANLLAHETSGVDKNLVAPEFDMEFLKQAGAVEHLPKWRKIAETAHIAETKMVG